MPALGWWLMAVGALRVGLTCSGFFGAATYARAESTYYGIESSISLIVKKLN